MEQSSDGRGLAGADLEEGGTAIGYQVTQAGGDSPVAVEAIGTAGQGDARLEGGHFRFQVRPFSVGDIGRVAQHYVKRPGKAFSPVAPDQAGAGAEAEGYQVAPGDGEGRGVDVEAQAPPPGALAEQGCQQAAAAAAQVEDGSLGRRRPGQGGLDQGLGIGARNQGVPGNGEGETPELAVTRDMGQGLARRAALHQSTQALALPFLQASSARVQNVLDQEAGVEPGLGNSGLGQVPYRLADDDVDARAQFSSARRAA